MNTVVFALLSIASSVAAQFLLKAGMSSPRARLLMAQPPEVRRLAPLLIEPYIVAGFALYFLGALIWLAVLSKWDVSKAYPLVGFGFVLALVIGAVAGETVTLPRVAGALLICSGIWLVARS